MDPAARPPDPVRWPLVILARLARRAMIFQMVNANNRKRSAVHPELRRFTIHHSLVAA